MALGVFPTRSASSDLVRPRSVEVVALLDPTLNLRPGDCLRRLGRETAATAVIGHEQMLPAAAQGAIGVEMRENDAFAARLLRPLNHPATEHMVQAERAFLAALDGSCRTPIAALAEMRPEGRMRLRGQILRHDGSQILETERLGAVADAARMGFDAGLELRRRGGDGFFTQPA